MLLLGEQTALQAVLDNELAAVEDLFARELVSDLACVNELALHLEQYRGKMLRPTLVLLSGLAIDPDRPPTHAHHVLAAVVEMVHMATLVHDDVLDEQDVRRKAVTINKLRGNEAAVMLGDYLISHAYHLCSSLGSQEAAGLIARTTNTVCEGELLQLSNRLNWALDEPTYFKIIDRKTASLCGVSCRLGAIYAQGRPQQVESLEAYGRLTGTAFQIIDDVLDLMGDPKVVGKSLGKDLEKGKLTLPLIHALATASGPRKQQLLDLINKADHDSADEVVRILAAGDSIAYARHRAESLIEQAKNHLATLPDSPVRTTLLAMADAVISRQA